jgi:hypothetical protein
MKSKESAMKKNSLFFIFLSLVLVMVSLGGCLPVKKEGGLEKKSAEEETQIPSGWQEYQDEERKLAFAYPPDWQFSVFTDQPKMFGISVKKDDPYYSINITVQDNPQGLSAKEERLSQFMAGTSRETEAAKLLEIMVDGQKAVRYAEGAAPASGPSTVVSVAYAGKIYRFTYSAMATQETHEKFLDVFDQLMQTVKFLP